MKVALIGSSGRVGSRLVAELLRRGHTVTGIERDPKKAETRAGLTVKRGDATKPEVLAPLVTGHDAVISASRFQSSDANALIAAVKKVGVDRLLVVGGAGSLEVGPGMTLMESPGFPESYAPEARAGAKFLDILRQEKQLGWTFLSPSAEFSPGMRTCRFRLGGNELLSDQNGRSWISMEDFAIAMVDELEHPRHSRHRFTVGY
jgi:putative NADH-flavin reductase